MRHADDNVLEGEPKRTESQAQTPPRIGDLLVICTQISMLIISWHIFKYTEVVCIIYSFLCPQNEYLMSLPLFFSPRMKEKSLNSLSGGGTQVSLSVFVLPLSSCLWREFVELAKLSWQKPRPDNVVNVCFHPVCKEKAFSQHLCRCSLLSTALNTLQRVCSEALRLWPGVSWCANGIYGDFITGGVRHSLFQISF